MMFTILKMLFNIDIHHVSCHNMWHRLDLKEQNLEYKVSSKDFMQPIIQCIMRDIVNILLRCQINLLFARLQLQVLWPCYFVILGTLTFFDILCCWVVLWEQRFTSRRYPSLHHYNWQWFSTFEFHHYLNYFNSNTI